MFDGCYLLFCLILICQTYDALPYSSGKVLYPEQACPRAIILHPVNTTVLFIPPCTPLIVKLRFTGVCVFLIFALKHRLWGKSIDWIVRTA